MDVLNYSETVTSVEFIFGDNLEEVKIYDEDGKDNAELYINNFNKYYGDCYLKDDKEEAYLRLADNCVVLLDVCPEYYNDNSLTVRFLPPIKDEKEIPAIEAEYRKMLEYHSEKGWHPTKEDNLAMLEDMINNMEEKGIITKEEAEEKRKKYGFSNAGN